MFVYFYYLNNRHSFLSSGVGESMIKTLADPVSGESPFLVHREPSLPVLIWWKALISSLEQILEDGRWLGVFSTPELKPTLPLSF